MQRFHLLQQRFVTYFSLFLLLLILLLFLFTASLEPGVVFQFPAVAQDGQRKRIALLMFVAFAYQFGLCADLDAIQSEDYVAGLHPVSCGRRVVDGVIHFQAAAYLAGFHPDKDLAGVALVGIAVQVIFDVRAVQVYFRGCIFSIHEVQKSHFVNLLLGCAVFKRTFFDDRNTMLPLCRKRSAAKQQKQYQETQFLYGSSFHIYKKFGERLA